MAGISCDNAGITAPSVVNGAIYVLESRNILSLVALGAFTTSPPPLFSALLLRKAISPLKTTSPS